MRRTGQRDKRCQNERYQNEWHQNEWYQICRVFADGLFGRKREGLFRPMLVSLVVYYGLYTAEIHIAVHPFFFFLILSAFTGGVMWQTLLTEGTAEKMQNLFMLPFEREAMILGCVCSLGFYVAVTKTLLLFAVLAAVSGAGWAEGAAGLLCVFHAVLIASCIFAFRRRGILTGIAGTVPLAVFWLTQSLSGFVLLLLAESFLAVCILKRADAYAFCRQKSMDRRILKGRRRHSIWRYFGRYLWLHKNYLVNSGGMCAVAALLPWMFRGMDARFVLPLGFALLSFHTPLCILLSSDPSLEQAVRFLPGQKKAFCVPYALFLSAAFLVTDMIFLCSWEVQNGGVRAVFFAAAFCFALAGGTASVMMEWYFPIRSWKTESDLWHHPRKYIVPAVMLLLAAAAGSLF